MSDTAILVENLSKQYRIGKRQQHNTLRDSIADIVSAPFRRFSSNGQSRNGHSNPADASSTNTIWALKDVSFEVKRGEVVGVIGRNGAGKSTLLKILSRITEPTDGHVRIRGRVASLLEVGTGFHAELSGRENIYLNGAVLGMKRAEIARKFDEIVAFAEVEKFIDTPVKHYSSGMYLRLAFAVAAHLEPEILLVDEVLAVGDASFQKKCLGKMGEVAREGRTVLFVSHNLGAVRSLCQEGALISTGRLAKYGGIHEIVATYLKSLSTPNKNFQPQRRRKGITALLESLQIVEFDTRKTNYFEPGRNLAIEFKIACQEKVRNLSVGFSIHAEDGNIVTLCYSGPCKTFDLTEGIHLVRARLYGFSLTPGLYTIRARLEANGIEVDWPQGDLAEFEIILPESLLGSRPEGLANGRLLMVPDWDYDCLDKNRLQTNET